MKCDVASILGLPVGEEDLSTPLLEIFTCQCCLLCGLTKYMLLAQPSAPPQSQVCWQLTLVSLRHCLHQATSTDVLKSGPRTTVVVHLDPLWELWRQLTLTWPSPPTCTHPLSPEVLRSDCPSCQSTHRLFGCSVGAKFTAPTAEV